MRKTEQLAINEEVKDYVARLNRELSSARKIGQLRRCSADVYETENFYVLRSYGTIVACIDKNTDTLVDFLRLVYGYTATSAQHISKFWTDYSKDHMCCRNFLRYYEV